MDAANLKQMKLQLENPEVINAGDSDFRTTEGDGYSYPMLRTVTLGLNLTF